MSIEHKYLYNGTLVTLDELHAAGVLLGATQPVEATVYGVSGGTYEGQTATQYAGSGGDCMVVVETPDEVVATLNQDGSMSNVTVQGGSTAPVYINGSQVVADSSKTYTLTDAYRSGAWVGEAYSTYTLVVTNGLLYFKFTASSGSGTGLGAVKYTVS